MRLKAFHGTNSINLREQCLAYVHAILRAVENPEASQEPIRHFKSWTPRILRNHTQYCTYSSRGVNQPDTSGSATKIL